MIKDAQEYGSLNVHMRAQRTELFSAGTYNLLTSSTDFDNLRQMLANTRYNDIIGTEMVKKYPNLIEIDRRLTQHFVDKYNTYKKFIPKRAKKFVDVLSEKYYLGNIKTIFAAFHGANRFEDARGMLITLSPQEDDDIEQLFKAANVEQLIELIKDEKLRDALEGVIGEYHFLELVYPLITVVDQYYYSKLCNEMTNLKGEDSRKTKMLFSAQIGIQNLEIILRAKTLDVKPNIIKKWLIKTKLCPLRDSMRDKLINAQFIETAFEIIRDETPFKELGIRLLDNIEQEKPPLDNFDRIADQIIIHKANSLFRGASFNIAIFPAFFLLKEMEIRNLRTIILGKIHKRSNDEILDKMVLV
ncbi:MAG: V-type ATPase subunit [Candidatus Heimdallarchaeota archaeon]